MEASLVRNAFRLDARNPLAITAVPMPQENLRSAGWSFLRQTEVPMTMHDDHHITDAEDALFDKTIKIVGVVIALVVITGMAMALWSSYS
jgi:hypothetical protein